VKDFHADATFEKEKEMMWTIYNQGGGHVFGNSQYKPYSNGLPIPHISRELNDGREGWIGWLGFGGSVVMWHPQCKLGFAYVPAELHIFDNGNSRGRLIQEVAVKCAEKYLSP
jgi:CubicO group peptidase (beta-lactamase class C family)